MATYNSNIYAAGVPARYGVYPSWVFGYVSIASTVTLATTDTINLCLIPSNTSLCGQFVLDLPDLESGSTSLTLNLQDNSSATSGGILPGGTTAETSPIVYVSASTAGQAGGIVTGASLVAGKLGTTYANQQILQLVPANSGGSALGSNRQINFMFSFQPL